MRLLTIYNQA